jgi:ubiquinone/menaquinone biosynthesis C-methylase UbiE
MNSPTVPTTHTAFDGLAATYDRYRPGYPEAIFDAIFVDIPASSLSGCTVVDIGCGTGISTRALARRVGTVIGIDPGKDMLEKARHVCAGLPNVRFVLAAAEATTLGDASVDVVVAAQAFHWFDHPAALKEFHRILRPGGRCALLWNVRTSDGGFTDDYDRIVVSADVQIDPSVRAGRTSLAEPLERSELFRDVRVVSAPSPQILNLDGAIGRATSASYFPKTEPERTQRLERLRHAFARHAVGGFVTLQQEARLTIATRR